MYEGDPDGLIVAYGPDAAVGFPSGAKMTLGQALQLEALFCTADPRRRFDVHKRVGYVASLLAMGESLLPEHRNLLLPTPDDQVNLTQSV